MIPIVLLTALPVSRVLAELDFLGRSEHSKLERLLTVFGHAALTRVTFHVFVHKYISVIIDAKIVKIVHFHILPTLDLGRHRKFDSCLLFYGTEPLALDTDM